MVLEENNYKEKINKFTYQDWEPLIELIPKIESTSKFSERPGPEKDSKGTLISYGDSLKPPIISEFIKIIYNLPIVIDFDWSSWKDGQEIISNENFNLDKLDLPTKCKLATVLARKDRFCDGVLASVFESGFILRILKSIERQIENNKMTKECNMNEPQKTRNPLKGFVYILEVKDIDLPVCKIGMTSRQPETRCTEINKSSTGDFLWEVHSYFPVSDCKGLEKLIHKKLLPYRQKGREFFNINAEIANNAIKSIINNQTDIHVIKIAEHELMEATRKKSTKTKTTNSLASQKDQYANVLFDFVSLLNVTGRPFGQYGSSGFGVSDGNEGVQWNLAVYPNMDIAKLGVNLEGLKYINWPITDFILSELEQPTLLDVIQSVATPQDVTLCFLRDAWQVTSRPAIEEGYLSGSDYKLSSITDRQWFLLLTQALGCLNPLKEYRGRNMHLVTMEKKPNTQQKKKELPVSPHLHISCNIDLSGDTTKNLKNGISLLSPVYSWVEQILKNAKY